MITMQEKEEKRFKIPTKVHYYLDGNNEIVYEHIISRRVLGAEIDVNMVIIHKNKFNNEFMFMEWIKVLFGIIPRATAKIFINKED